MSTPLGMYDTGGVPVDVIIATADGKPMAVTAAYWHPTRRVFFVIFDRGNKRSRHLSVGDARREIAKPPLSKWWHVILPHRVRPTV